MKEELKELENFLLNNEDLYKMNSILSQPNPFEILGIEKDEYRHSNVLAWLFNTSGSHTLKDFFLRSFLKDIFSKYRNSLNTDIDFFDIEIFDFDDVEVRREWKNIDLLILSRQNKLVIVIENKIDSSEHSNQLQRYFNITKKEFPGYNSIFIYLTREGETPSDEDNWLIYSYSDILELINRILNYRKNSLNQTTINFLDHYQTILRRYIVGNSEIERICRNIYEKHKKALDLIYQYKPDIQLEIQEKLQDIIENHPNLILDDSPKTYIRFIPIKIDNILPKNSEGWTSSNRILLFEAVNYDNNLFIKLTIGPGNDETRNKLYQIANNNKSIFNKANRKLGKKWSTIYKKILLTKNDFEENDTQSLLDIVEIRFNKFINNNLDKLEETIINNWNK